MDIKYCTGCFGCWVKTPGECVVPDDMRDIRREYIHSDFVLFASLVIMGFTSALLKKAHDKLIPLIHPYFELVQNEVHHLSRYDTYPQMGLLLEKGKDTDDFIKLFREAEQVLLAFPLYTDAIPAIVKTFIESREPLCGSEGNPDIGFILFIYSAGWLAGSNQLTICKAVFRKPE